MDSRPSGPVVLTAEEKAVLNEGIGLILSRWTAMRAAVDNGWGGRDSHLKAERTVSNVLDYFIRLKGEIRCSSHWTPTIGPGSLEAPSGLRGKRISPEERLWRNP
ncbi:hypothetical protein F2Q68_00018800 [Brassica cretica]|uniref:Uncharacterized protein n=1 Tax=Brassica cretica TaxID=69181 RepID=A0A8S9FZI1_BRACR|nr:hypothetical protein F2Q68_00018800 [Brassica cretica]